MAQESFPIGRRAVCVFNDADVVIASPVNDTTITAWLGDAGTKASGNITDVTQGTSPIYANTNTRENTAGGFASQKPVLREGSVTFEILWNTLGGGANQATSFEQILVNKADDLTGMSLGFFDYDPLGTIEAGDTVQGLCGNFFIAVEKSEAIEDVQRFSVTCTVANGAAWHKIVGS